jgi:ubiquinol-cytochrome c reductase cytochrome c1 subunit
LSTQYVAKGSSSSWAKFVPVGLGLTGAAALVSLAQGSADASEDCLHPPMNRPEMTNKLLSYDAASLRRGYEVYKQVCATCHSVDGIRYGQLVNTILLESEAKLDAAEHEYRDGPDETGDYFERPGKVTDPLPKPYPNAEAARFANNGALPPSLTLLVGARHAGSYYIFSLLTGYQDAPAGVVMAPGMHYNPYFAGGQIAMPPPLHEGMLEFKDGTPATISQMAKDVAHFMEWTLAPRWNDDKHIEVKKFVILLTLSGFAFYYNKTRWAVLKTRQLRRF